MLKLNYKSGVPICDQIVNGFVRMKALGLVESGEQLPSVRALAMELGVNPNTIQKAYQILETNGIIYSVKGKGSFISDDAAADTAVIMSAKRDFRAAVFEGGIMVAEVKGRVADGDDGGIGCGRAGASQAGAY